MNWQEFFAMGGYAVFVWPSYGLTAVLLLLNVVVPHRRERRLLCRLEQQARNQRQ